MAKATFGAGCFWGVEAAFRRIDGVTDAAVGYAGGHKENPTYRDVCSDGTGHAEVVEIEYDPARVSYETLLDTFWEMHDPTQLNRQGPDVGDQYRSVIFFHSPEQEEEALSLKGATRRQRRAAAPGRHPDSEGPDLLARRGVPPALPREKQRRRLQPRPRRRRPITLSEPYFGCCASEMRWLAVISSSTLAPTRITPSVRKRRRAAKTAALS